MRILPRRIEFALDVTVQRSHDPDAREHRRASERDDEDQSFHCRLPFLCFMLGLRKLRDVIAGILEREKLAPAGELDRIVKRPLPTTIGHRRPVLRVAFCHHRNQVKRALRPSSSLPLVLPSFGPSKPLFRKGSSVSAFLRGFVLKKMGRFEDGPCA